MLYTSVNNPKIKELKKLKQKKYRDQSDLFLVEGQHLVEEAYKAGYLKELLLEQNETYKLDIETSYLDEKVIKEISSLDTPYKILGLCEKKESNTIGNKILMLDEVQDPGNLGTIIRSAVAFNVDTIILSKDCADIYSSKVIRASQGMLFHTNIVITDLKEKITELKEQNYRIMGTRVISGNPLKNVTKTDKSVIIMGNEGNGVKPEILELCDEYVYIEMNELCESLNVAVATSIILYEMGR